MLLALLLVQATGAVETPPDIELNIRARARSVEIERKGEAKLEVRAEPEGGSRIEARVEPLPEGRTTLRNVEVNLNAQARLNGSVKVEAGAETAPPR